MADTVKLELTKEWDKTFPKSERVNHRKVTFPNRYGITLAADLYEPKESEKKLAAIAVCGPFGAVKEQAAGLYAQKKHDEYTYKLEIWQKRRVIHRDYKLGKYDKAERDKRMQELLEYAVEKEEQRKKVCREEYARKQKHLEEQRRIYEDLD